MIKLLMMVNFAMGIANLCWAIRGIMRPDWPLCLFFLNLVIGAGCVYNAWDLSRAESYK